MSAVQEFAEAVWAVRPESVTMTAYTGTVVSVVFSASGVSSATVMLRGSTQPMILPVSGAFAAEVAAADQASTDLVGRTVLVWKVNNQPHVAYTVGGTS